MTHPLHTDAFSSEQTFRQAAFITRIERAKSEDSMLASRDDGTFGLAGFCVPCDREVTFHVDYQNAWEHINGKLVPNWRETVLCPHCRLNSRSRGVLHLLSTLNAASHGHDLYISEQLTPLYLNLAATEAAVTGSEFISSTLSSGQIRDGLRHEDIVDMSFDDQSFDFVLTFDVLEHVPAYRDALAELHRITRQGGRLIASFPMNLYKPQTTIRATIDQNGQIEHLMEPEYHGDPVKPGEGILCFYHFGWNILDDIREAGFNNAEIIFFRDTQYGYPGAHQYLVSATK